jgi:hypothetical protein
MKLVLEVMRREDNERIANRVGEMLARGFSAENFNILFDQKTFVADWTFDDALGIWYCVGRLCFLISIGSMMGLPEADATNVIELGQKALMKTWKMSAPTLKRSDSGIW